MPSMPARLIRSFDQIVRHDDGQKITLRPWRTPAHHLIEMRTADQDLRQEVRAYLASHGQGKREQSRSQLDLTLLLRLYWQLA